MDVYDTDLETTCMIAHRDPKLAEFYRLRLGIDVTKIDQN